MHPDYQQVGTPSTRLIEECSELIKALCKAERFGLFDYHPATPDVTNRDAILAEIADVERMIAEVRGILIFGDSKRDEG